MTTVDCSGIDLGSNEDDMRVWTADVSWVIDDDQLVDAEDLAAHVAAIGQMMLGVPVEQLAERIAAQLANQSVFRSVTVTVHMHWAPSNSSVQRSPQTGNPRPTHLLPLRIPGARNLQARMMGHCRSTRHTAMPSFLCIVPR